VEDVGRRVDKSENFRTEHAGEQGDDSREGHGNAHGIGYIDPHLVIVLTAESLCHGDGKAGARPVAESHDQKVDRRRRTHGSQCTDTDPPSHDGRVNDLIHLLEYIAQHQRQSKMKNAASR